MRKCLLLLTLAVLSLYCTSCGGGCGGKEIGFGFNYGRKNDTFKVYVDEQYKWGRVLKEHYMGRFHSPRDRMFRICATADSVLVRIKVNQRDTSFYLLVKEIRECYIGANIDGYITVVYNYEEGGFREYSPVR